MHLRFLHVFSWLDSLFLLIIEWYSIVWRYHSFFMHLPTEGHLGCFQVLAIMNKTVINIHMHMFSTHLGKSQGMQLASLYCYTYLSILTQLASFNYCIFWYLIGKILPHCSSFLNTSLVFLVVSLLHELENYP